MAKPIRMTHRDRTGREWRVRIDRDVPLPCPGLVCGEAMRVGIFADGITPNPFEHLLYIDEAADVTVTLRDVRRWIEDEVEA